MDMRGLPFGKPVKKSKDKNQKLAIARAVVSTVRESCVNRDGPCRIKGVERFPPCDGPSEWAHFGEMKRAKTRGMDPSERHTRQGSLMMCRHHHALYDGRAHHQGSRLQIEALTTNGTDGPLRFELAGVVYDELIISGDKF